jgi:hypothetical protein
MHSANRETEFAERADEVTIDCVFGNDQVERPERRDHVIHLPIGREVQPDSPLQ